MVFCWLGLFYIAYVLCAQPVSDDVIYWIDIFATSTVCLDFKTEELLTDAGKRDISVFRPIIKLSIGILESRRL